MRRQLYLGIALIVSAFFCVAVMSAFGKAASQVPTPSSDSFKASSAWHFFYPGSCDMALRTYAQVSFRCMLCEQFRGCCRNCFTSGLYTR